MNISNRFRKDLGYYMLGVLVPGFLNAAIVPLLKHLLGAAGFGLYGIRFSLLLLLVAFTVGWLSQSIIRFKFAMAGQEPLFYRKIFLLGGWVLSIVGGVSLVLNLLYYSSGLVYSILFFGAFLFCGLQNILIGISQANFLSRFTMYSEALRTIVFFLSATLLLYLKWLSDINALFLAFNISYMVSGAVLFAKNKLHIWLFTKTSEGSRLAFETKQLFHYGLPLATWFLISYLMLFLDKPLLASQMGHEVQGHYQALYELVSKGAVVVLIPVTYALFPLLASAFEGNDERNGIRLLKKIILIELVIMSAGLLCYWFFGFSLLQYLLNVPDNKDYKTTGLLMLASTFIWQVGILLHKPFEMRKDTFMLLWFALAALLVFGLLYFILTWLTVTHVYCFTLPFMGASLTYVAACLAALGQHKKLTKYWNRLRSHVSNKTGV